MGTAPFALAYTAELGDVITITDEAASILDQDYYIESIRQSIRPGKLHEWSWQLTAKDATPAPFVFDSSALDSADVLVY